MNVDTTNPTNNENETTAGTGDNQETPDITKLMSALEKERTARRELEAKLKQQQSKETELTASLEKYKAVDPEKYEKLLQAQREQEEKELVRRKEFDVLQARYRSETEAAQKVATDWQRKYEDTIIENAVKTAFFECNGRKASFDLSADGLEDVPPVQAIFALLRSNLRVSDGRIVILDALGNVENNKEGRPKTVTEKMLELRKGSMGTLFEPENNNVGTGMTPTASYGGKAVKVFSLEQARTGKASIDDIASGRAIISG